MANVPNWLVPVIIRATGRNKVFVTEAGALERIRERVARPEPFEPPKKLRADVEVKREDAAGWPVYTITPTAGKARGSVVYLHGGGWVNEIVALQWQFAAQIAAEASTVVTVPIYPLVPKGTAAEALRGAREIAESSLKAHGSVVLVGDSAGGQISLSTAQVLRDAGVALPLTVLVSPAVDQTFNNPRIPEVQPSDPWLAVPGGRVLADKWRGELELTDPVVSPLFGKFKGLGPVAIYTGTRDVLNPDAHLLTEKAKDAGVEVSFTEQAGQLHVYPLLPTKIGAAARRDIAERIKSALS